MVDKGWNAGVRDNYPNVENVGYQGFADISPMHQNVYPTNLEKKFIVLPVATPNSKYKKFSFLLWFSNAVFIAKSLISL